MTMATFIQASAHQLTGIADGTVQAIVTSPPYYGLRRYEGEQDIDWHDDGRSVAALAQTAGVRVTFVHVELGRVWSVERRTVDGREGGA